MQILSKMNAKMDEGYKMTNYSCEFCSGVTLCKPNSDGLNPEGKVYCPKCNKQYVPSNNQGGEQDEQQQYYNQIYKNENNQKNIQLTSKRQKFINKRFKEQAVANPGTKTQDTKERNEQELDPVQRQYQQFLKMYNSTVKTPQQMKSQQISKKIGEKLIGGWAMMEQACLDCNVPLMKSKKGNLICCGCDKDYAHSQSNQQHLKNKEQNSNSNKQNQQHNNINSSYNLKSSSDIKIKQQGTKNIKKTQQLAKNKLVQMRDSKNQKLKEVEDEKSDQQQEQKSLASKKLIKLVNKTLNFLDIKLQQAFQMNDMQAVDRILGSIKKAKELL